MTNLDDFHQLASGAHSSYDTAPAPVFKGLPSLLAMSRLFNALPMADVILVSTSVNAILIFTLPSSGGVYRLRTLRTYGHCLNRTGTRIATAVILSTSRLSDMGDLDKRLYTSPHAPTDTVARVGPDRVKLARNGGMLPRVVRLSLSNCTHQLHPCTVLTAAHHTHTRPPDVPARIASPQSMSNTYSSLELRSSPRV